MFQNSRALCSEKGIPEQKQGKYLPQETIITITQFYEDDEFSYMLPGAKDCISIKKILTCRNDFFDVN